jgi:hypothetical protein
MSTDKENNKCIYLNEAKCLFTLSCLHICYFLL